jgi:hypothetical protein
MFIGYRYGKRYTPINGDKKSLEEALINLFVNSLEAMGEHGKLFVVVQKDVFAIIDKKSFHVSELILVIPVAAFPKIKSSISLIPFLPRNHPAQVWVCPWF